MSDRVLLHRYHPIQAASVVGFAVLFTGIAELVRGES